MKKKKFAVAGLIFCLGMSLCMSALGAVPGFAIENPERGLTASKRQEGIAAADELCRERWTGHPNAALLSALTPESERQFFDLPHSHWAVADVRRGVELGFVNGYADGSFQPHEPVTRAEFVTMLWKIAGSPAAVGDGEFTDVPADSWFAPQITWAKSCGLVDGMTDTEFEPNGQITREQSMTILFRQAGAVSGMESMFGASYDKHFTDSDKISDWARPAIYWGIFHELIVGVTDNTLEPKSPANRAQAVAILLRNYDRAEKCGEK